MTAAASTRRRAPRKAPGKAGGKAAPAEQPSAAAVPAEVTVAASDQPATAAMLCLGKEPECTPQCLLAVGTEINQCGCPCQGRHHGKLAHVPVPETQRKPPAERVDEPALFPVTQLTEFQGVSA